jgi:LCP family protein required for cell wall assembly
MRTTLKRGVGRGAAHNGNGKAVFPPESPAPETQTFNRYRQPPPSSGSALGLFGRIVLVVVLVVTSLGIAVAGGSYLYFHQSVAAVQAHTPSVVRASARLNVPLADHAAIALIIGYDHRANEAKSDPSLSDTVMLARADPVTKTISLLSFPRDLEVPIYCPRSKTDTEGDVVSSRDRINSAYSRCQDSGTLLTVEHLTGLRVNYLITVNFHGFKEIVDKLGGVWMDVDRRYYNKNTGAGYNDFASINLQPGYQLLSGQQALDFVRYRHTDSDLVRNARQQEFVRAFREQISQSFSPFEIPSLISTLTRNIEVGEGGGTGKLSTQVLQYAEFAQSLPSGHLFQDKIENVQCANTCYVEPSDMTSAVQQFTSPDVTSSKAANAAALGVKQKTPKAKAPAPSKTTVTVLNGNGEQGAAAQGTYALAQLGYQVLDPPNGLEPNMTPMNYFHTKIYYDPVQAGSKLAATALQALMQPADVAKMPRLPALISHDPGSMLMVVLGETFHNTIEAPVTHQVIQHQPALVRSDTSDGANLLDPLQKKVPFPLLTPTVVERNSYPDLQPGDKAVRLYWMDPDKREHKAVRLVFHNGNEYWGIQESNWADEPALSDKSFQRSVGGREMQFYYSGTHLHMIVLNAHGASYWVVNTLQDDLTNETMIAIAKGLKPLTSVK